MAETEEEPQGGRGWIQRLLLGDLPRGTAAGIVAALLGASWAISVLLGGAGRVPPHWFYFPILVASAALGRWPGVATALASGLLAGPLLPADTATGAAQATSDWLTRGGFFLGVGLVMADVLRRLQSAVRRERDGLDRQRRAQEELQASEVRLAHLVASNAGGIALVDTNGRIHFANPAAEEILGLSHDRILEASAEDPALGALDVRGVGGEPVPMDPGFLSRMVETATPVRGIELEITRKDGKSRVVSLNLTPLPDPVGEPRIVVSFIDITERVEIERSLRQALRREIEAGERLLALDEMKNDILTAFSHELRTPLTSVLGFAQILANDDGALGPDSRRELAGRLAANATRLEALLEAVMDVEQLARGGLEPQRADTDVAELVWEVVERSELAAGVPLELDLEPARAAVEPARVVRIVENLLGNLERHTPPGTPARIRVRPEGSGARIEVEDDGPGVPEELRDAVFEPLRQGPSLNPHQPGVGLGLALVRRSARLHGGEAWIEPSPAGGTRVCVTLPSA